MMDSGGWATVIVAAIALVSAIFSGRSAANASKYTSRTQAETEAYSRARKMDIETIERQDREIEELQEKVAFLKQDNEVIHQDNDRLRGRVTRLEQKLTNLGVPLD